MSESSGEVTARPNSLKTRLLRAAGAFAVLATSFGAGAAYNEVHQPERLTLGQVQDQIQTYEHANLEAKRLSRQINETAESGDSIQVTVLNGVVRVGDPSLKIEWERVFVLGGFYKTSPPENDVEDMLEGQWIGLQSTDNEGKLSIVMLPYDAKTMHFEAYDQGEAVESLNVRAFPPRKGGGDTIAYIAYGVDPADPNRPLVESDGSFVLPGRASGNK